MTVKERQLKASRMVYTVSVGRTRWDNRTRSYLLSRVANERADGVYSVRLDKGDREIDDQGER